MNEIEGISIRIIEPDQEPHSPNFSTVGLRALRAQQRTLKSQISRVQEVRRQKHRLSTKKWAEKPYIEE